MSVLVSVDMTMDVLYLSISSIDLKSELGYNAEWYDYIVCFSESDLFLFFTIIFTIFRISGGFQTLDDFWSESTLAEKLSISKIAAGENNHESNVQNMKATVELEEKLSPKIYQCKLLGGILLLIFLVVSGIYLIIWTESHLQQAVTMCDSTSGYISSEEDIMKTWGYGSCRKGKVFPFVPIEGYNSPTGNILYCDCKYAIIPYIVNGQSAVSFVNNMRSLRWVYWQVVIDSVNRTIISNRNLKLLFMHIIFAGNENAYLNHRYNIDLSASTNVRTIWIDAHAEYT